jgi:hypothetical protein
MQVWTSFREYIAAVVKQWWFYVGVVSGILALVGQVTSVPQIPRGITIAGFVVFLSAAQFAAFHRLRFERDEGEQAGLTLLAQARWWSLGGVAYTYDQYGTTLLATPAAFANNPEVKLDFVTDIEMEAHGGGKGGAIFDIAWTIRNLPDAATFEAPIVVGPITLVAGEIKPLRPRLSIQLDKVRLADLRRVWEELPGDPVLTAQYHVKNMAAAEARLTLPRSRLLDAIAPWRKMVGLPPEG